METTSPQAILYGQLLDKAPRLNGTSAGLLGYKIDPSGLALDAGYIQGFPVSHRHQHNCFSGGVDWAVRAERLPKEWVPADSPEDRTPAIEALDELFLSGFGRLSMFPCDLEVFSDVSDQGVKKTGAQFTCQHFDYAFTYPIDQIAAVEQLSESAGACWYLANNLQSVMNWDWDASGAQVDCAMLLIGEEGPQLLADRDQLLGIVW